MTRDDMNRWEAEIDSWRQRYKALLKTLADDQYLAKPMMLADKQSYELGLLHGAAAEREACAQTARTAMLGAEWVLTERVMKAIRARSNT